MEYRRHPISVVCATLVVVLGLCTQLHAEVGNPLLDEPQVLEAVHAGSPEINGLWRIKDTLYGGVVAYYKEYQGRYFELFLHYDEEDDAHWWNIQEGLRDPDTGELRQWGSPFYICEVAAPAFTRSVQPFGWETYENHPQMQFLGVAPGPNFLLPERSAKRSATSSQDCQNKECYDYYTNLEDYRDFVNASRMQLQPDAVSAVQCQERLWSRALTAKEIKNFRKSFDQKGVVKIPDWLISDKAAELRQELLLKAHPLLWQRSFFDHEGDRARIRPDYPHFKELFDADLKDQHEQRAMGHFSYSFHRTVTDVPRAFRQAMRSLYDDVEEFLKGRQMKEMLKAVTGKDYILETFFASKYQSGDYLGEHTDSVDTRKIAFVLHLSLPWNVGHGGLFTILSEEGTPSKLVEAFVPTFNTLLFFDVSEEKRLIPHMVTEVAADCLASRVAFSGWYAYKEDGDEHQLDQVKGWDY